MLRNSQRYSIFHSQKTSEKEAKMNAPESLILDLLTFLGATPKPYRQVMDAWRTNCPRLPVWEDAVDLGLVRHQDGFVVITEAGKRRLEARS